MTPFPRAAAAFVFTILCATTLAGGQAAGFYDVRSFGATGDGKTMDTPAINRAIDAAAEERSRFPRASTSPHPSTCRATSRCSLSPGR